MVIRTRSWVVGLLAFAVLISAPGCATTTGQSKDAEVAAASEGEEEDEGWVCRREHRTGTNISKLVCYTPEQRNRHAHDRREEDQQKLRDSARWGCEGEPCGREPKQTTGPSAGP